MISRNLKLSAQNSYILLGPRQTGKSTLLKELSQPVSTWGINLLIQKQFRKYLKNPSIFRDEVLYQIKENKIHLIIVDEVQKVPELLDEVHSLIEETDCRFWLSGSSARKLKRGSANLLAGRAFVQRLFPFTYSEVKSMFNLEDSLQLGLLAGVFLKERAVKKQILRTYVDTYLREEIQAEGIVRQLAGFDRFLEIAAQCVGEPINYSSIGRDAGIIPKTTQNYFDILEDTLIAFRLPCWSESVRKQLAQHPKFYLFDNGVTCSLLYRLTDPLDASLQGKLMEQWIAHEMRAALSYNQSEKKLYTWRTIDGSQEVDFLLAHAKKVTAAIEVKSFQPSEPKHFSGLRAIKEEFADIPRYLVCTVTQPYKQDGIEILPWNYFLETTLPKLTA